MTQEFIELTGEFYQSVLARLHSFRQPDSYFEIGSLTGDTLKLANCASVSVDPHFQLNVDIVGSKPSCQLFQTESDIFFSSYSLSGILGRELDLAFLDGMHLFEFLLRDFINTERYCSPSGMIVMHDCLPGDDFICVRDPADPIRQKSRFPGYWTGDVWKIIPILLEYRPDLQITCLDANPTGLVLVENLSPKNNIISSNYDQIIERFRDVSLTDFGVTHLHEISNVKNAESYGRITSQAVWPDQSEGEVPNAVTGSSWGSAPRIANLLPIRGIEGCGDPSVTLVDAPSRPIVRAATAPTFHDDPDDARLFTDFDKRITTGTPTVIRLQNVRQIGYRTYMTPAGNFLIDEYLLEEQDRHYLDKIALNNAFANEDTGLKQLGSSGLFDFVDTGRPGKVIDDAIISLCSHEPSNYGSFLFRTLPKLADVPNLVSHCRVLTPVYTQSMRDLLAMAEVPNEQLIAHDTSVVYHLADAHVPVAKNGHGYLDESSLEFYKSIREKYGSRNRSKKVYVSRESWQDSLAASRRVMTNEATLIDRLKSEGFDIVNPQLLTAREQIQTFCSADLIVGPAGSAMFNVVFSNPGTQVVDIESEPHWILTHMNLFSSLDLQYGIFEGVAVDQDWSCHMKPFHVNIDALLERLASL